MPADDRHLLLRHLDDQTRYLGLLTGYARGNTADVDVLLRVRDEVFTLRETLHTLGVPGANLSNEEWDRVPHAQHKDPWPNAGDVPR
jgi:hypothetical protein